MSSRKDQETKRILEKEHNKSKRAPVWVFVATGRKVRFSPQSGRNWRKDKIF